MNHCTSKYYLCTRQGLCQSVPLIVPHQVFSLGTIFRWQLYFIVVHLPLRYCCSVSLDCQWMRRQWLNPTKHTSTKRRQRKSWGAWLMSKKSEEGCNANPLVYFASCTLNLSTVAFVLGTKAVKRSLFLCLPIQIFLNPQYYSYAH